MTTPISPSNQSSASPWPAGLPHDPEAPPWFSSALATTPQTGTLTAAGATLGTRAWGLEGRGLTVVLVHGAAAHARWWDHIGPLLSVHNPVVALDVSGHGDSSHRSQYELETWAEEVLATAEHFSPDRPVIVVGHSLGGLIALRAGHLGSERIRGVVAVDSGVREMTTDETLARKRRLSKPLRVYDDRLAAMAAFRLLPPQECPMYVQRYIAEHSIRSVEGGWAWKFDPRVFAQTSMPLSDLALVTCSARLVRPEFGMVDRDLDAAMQRTLPRAAPTMEIAGARHHVLLDRPLELVAALRATLELWD
jgi:pimeloyl-ACP methyl ester carboxylesterase